MDFLVARVITARLSYMVTIMMFSLYPPANVPLLLNMVIRYPLAYQLIFPTRFSLWVKSHLQSIRHLIPVMLAQGLITLQSHVSCQILLLRDKPFQTVNFQLQNNSWHFLNLPPRDQYLPARGNLLAPLMIRMLLRCRLALTKIVRRCCAFLHASY